MESIRRDGIQTDSALRMAHYATISRVMPLRTERSNGGMDESQYSMKWEIASAISSMPNSR